MVAPDYKASGWSRYSIGGLGILVYGLPLPAAYYKNIVKPLQLVIPTKEELFPPKEKGPPPPPPPPSV